MTEQYVINCPLRGKIKVGKKIKGRLSHTEEFYRVEAINHLISLGYPKDQIILEPIVKKFGNGGRNSFRSDFAVLDISPTSIDKNNIEHVLEHVIVLGEVKKDNENYDYVKETQVKPMLDFSSLDKCIGIYWDNIERRVFWKKNISGKREIFEGGVNFIPRFGENIETRPLSYNELEPSDSLVSLFDRIEDILHQASYDHSQRYEIILQIILSKIFDEHSFAGRPDSHLEIQDFTSLGVSGAVALQKMNALLNRAVSFYEKHLPNKVSKKFPLDEELILDICKLISPIFITRSRRDVVQTFYMKFAKHLYKWDLAQYFTPTQVTDFIVDIINPQFGEHVYDPACGSADFLVGAFHKLRQYNAGFADCIWGNDNSSNAVQVAILNMLLNGDGKTNINKKDSLETVNEALNRYDIVLCNPPFGTRIIEKRKSVLRMYDLGHEWESNGELYKKNDRELLASQETGILFAELCVKQAKSEKGRIALIVPNGYLGNRSKKYRVFREWLLLHTKVACIVGFPRFTFKSSGADVSASVIFLEKREQPLKTLGEYEDHPLSIQIIKNVGWEAGNKRATPIYKRDPLDGSFVLNDDGELIIDSDFESSLHDINSSIASTEFSWFNNKNSYEGWSIQASEILSDPELTLDPKRYCEKFVTLVERYKQGQYLTLGDLVDFSDEKTSWKGKKIPLAKEKEYKYVELQKIGQGDYDYEPMRGWQLPSRAKHFAEPGDIFFASIWSSVDKWCYIDESAEGIVVTNGCVRCRLKEEHSDWLPDLISFMCTEGWTSQLRALARGSDGLAEIHTEDLKRVIVPKLTSEEVKENLEHYSQSLISGRTNLRSAVLEMIRNNKIDTYFPEKRSSHIHLV